MIWAVMTKGKYKDYQLTSTHIDSHAKLVVVGQNSKIMNRSGKSADVMPFSSECAKL